MSGSRTLSGRDKNNGMHTRSLSLANTHREGEKEGERKRETREQNRVEEERGGEEEVPEGSGMFTDNRHGAEWVLKFSLVIK